MTVQQDTGLAPGCFGSPVIFRADHAICSVCMFSVQCQPISAERRVALHDYFGIMSKPVKPPQVKPVVQVQGVDIMVSKKAEIMMSTLERKGRELLKNLLAGRNPFQDSRKPKHMWAACKLLLARDGALTKEHLVTAFMTAFSWSRDHSVVHAAQALTVLKLSGTIRETNGRYSINRT